MSDGSPEQVKAQPGQSRQIRVFISSTFRDMQAERDYLVKFIFPQLRKLCESRGVTWGEVDLRWGVTDEQAAEGKVLPICLEEIKRCRPYFIGLLGERYGWIPETLPADLVEREEWLKEHLHGKTSVTELEILHGVLNDPKMAGHAFFYFRDPEYLNTVAENDRKDFTAENAKDAEKLCALKDRIRHSEFPVRENYPGPKELGELVLADLTKVINETWPEGSQPDTLDREAIDHEAYAQSREKVYIGRQEYFDRLDTHAAANDTQPLVILGESGSGKSALLANWVARYRQAHPDALVLQHYIGATPYSADWAAMLRRLMGEFKRRLGLQQDIPDQPDALRSAFPNWLYMAAAKGRVVLVLDALNQLEDRDGAPDLVWLPPVLPENVRLIVSTLPGRPLDEIQKRHWPTLKVELLSADERKELVRLFLKDYGRNVSPKQSERITNTPASANPLYLRVLLDELRVFGVYEKLDERIGHYLQAESPYALYEKVIARWEQDYEVGSDLVGDTLSLLWAARRGLTETELLQLLAPNSALSTPHSELPQLPRAKWSPLFLAMSDALISRGGLLTFAHDFLRTAVKNAYLPTEKYQERAHLRLADYFEQRPISPRRTDELPWQLAEAKQWQRLQMLLVDRSFFPLAWEQNQFAIKTYWTRVEARSDFRIVEGCRPQIEHPELEGDKNFLWCLTSLLSDTGHLDEALRIRTSLVEHFRNEGDLYHLQRALGNQAIIFRIRGDWRRAMALFKEQEGIGRRFSYLDTVAFSLGQQAVILIERWDFEHAMALLKEQERICRQLGDLAALQTSLGVQHLILQDRGDLDGAMALLREQERICRQLGNPQGLAVCLSGQASILQDRGDWDSALALLKEAERICRRLGSLDSLQACLGCQFSILQNHGDLDGGMALLKEQEQICRQIGNPLALKTALGGQAVIMVNRGDWDSALALLKEEERICRQLGNLVDLQHSLDFQASVLRSRGNLEDAIVLYKEHEEICRQLGKFDLLATTLGNRALTLMLLGRSEEGLPLAEEALRLANTHGYIEVAKQTTPIIDLLRQAALIHNPAPQHTHIPAATIASNDQTVSELRDSAATALKRGLWEAAETYLEKLLQQGEPLEIVAPDLITALLNAHETLSAATVTRIETLLAQLAAAGHTALVAELRQKLAAKQPKKSKWKFW